MDREGHNSVGLRWSDLSCWQAIASSITRALLVFGLIWACEDTQSQSQESKSDGFYAAMHFKTHVLLFQLAAPNTVNSEQWALNPRNLNMRIDCHCRSTICFYHVFKLNKKYQYQKLNILFNVYMWILRRLLVFLRGKEFFRFSRISKYRELHASHRYSSYTFSLSRLISARCLLTGEFSTMFRIWESEDSL